MLWYYPSAGPQQTTTLQNTSEIETNLLVVHIVREGGSMEETVALSQEIYKA